MFSLFSFLSMVCAYLLGALLVPAIISEFFIALSILFLAIDIYCIIHAPKKPYLYIVK